MKQRKVHLKQSKKRAGTRSLRSLRTSKALEKSWEIWTKERKKRGRNLGASHQFLAITTWTTARSTLQAPTSKLNLPYGWTRLQTKRRRTADAILTPPKKLTSRSNVEPALGELPKSSLGA